MKEETITLGYDIYEKVEKYNHEEFYHRAEDKDGNMYKTHYGHDGDNDWYITCYENLSTGECSTTITNIAFYYKKIGRTAKKYIYNRKLEDFVGEILKTTEIDNQIYYGFENYETNTFYVIK